MRQLALKIGVATGYLPMVIAGKRALPSAALEKLLPHLHLSINEQSYLRLIHTITESESPDVRLKAFKGLHKYSEYRELNPREFQTVRYLSRSLNVIVREMCQLKNFRLDPVWIRQRLVTKVPHQEIRAAITFLLESGFISKNPDGSATLKDRAIECMSGPYQFALGQYYRELFNLARDSISETKGSERALLSVTAAISPERFKQLKTKLEIWLNEIESSVQNDAEANRIYIFNLSAIPVTKGETQ